MNITEIMNQLETASTWKSTEQDTPELIPCPFCSGKPVVYVADPMYGWCGAAVRCPSCGAQGPRASIYATILSKEIFATPLLPESLERGILAAGEAWNTQSADRKRLGNLRMEPDAYRAYKEAHS